MNARFTHIGTGIIPALLAATMLLTSGLSAEAKHIGSTRAAIVGGVAGLAIGAAIADSYHHRKKKIYYESYVPAYVPGAYGPYFDQVLMPSPGITCYPAQRMCYHNSGGVSGHWTYKIYGY